MFLMHSYNDFPAKTQVNRVFESRRKGGKETQEKSGGRGSKFLKNAGYSLWMVHCLSLISSTLLTTFQREDVKMAFRTRLRFIRKSICQYQLMGKPETIYSYFPMVSHTILWAKEFCSRFASFHDFKVRKYVLVWELHHMQRLADLQCMHIAKLL